MQKYVKADYLKENLQKMNITELMPVQIKILEEFSKTKDIILTAKTGSGKTLAYLLPILQELDSSLLKTQLLILLPTNELAFQIYNILKKLLNNTKFDLKLYDSNTNSKEEAIKLEKRKPQIVVGTIGKIFDLAIRQNALKIHELSYFILDEADMALDNGFKEELDDILLLIKEAKKYLFQLLCQKK